MRRGGGSQKGSAFERRVCIALSEAMTDGKRNDLFWRTAMSGGRATRMNANRPGQRNMSQTGDICAIDPLGHYLTDHALIECKFHRTADLETFLINRKGRLAKWLNKAIKESDGKNVVIVFKQNFSPILVLTDLIAFMRNGLPCASLQPLILSYDKVRYPWAILTFDEFLRALKIASKEPPNAQPSPRRFASNGSAPRRRPMGHLSVGNRAD